MQVEDKYVKKALEIQRKLFTELAYNKNISKEDYMLYVCAGYNSEIAILLKSIDELMNILESSNVKREQNDII